ncbi:hypothetical protein G7Z17_g7721 [Cylindrodendrum hubeiense]|uniref:Potassium transport protein n=1 Tax=Cylindrodendrum hubeiense TaxID=595255 RepID=A0A9P5LDX8_9HYPO|nr:hypothetical protein G7Z17_g7721 [Cylindrodendrum hubeiense]
MFSSIKDRWDDLLEEHPRIASLPSTLRAGLPINYITIHYAYFILGSLLFSVILWGSNDPSDRIDFVDCMFLVVSSFTNTGLNSVDLSRLTTWQQVLLWILFIIGSVIWVSFWTVLARKHAFEKRFEDIVETERESRKRRAATKQTPAFRQFFSFEKFKTTPAESGRTLPGLGTRQHDSEKSEEAANDPDDLLSVGIDARRIVSCPEESISSDTEENPSRTTTLASETDTPRDHIRFAPSFGRQDRQNLRRGSLSIYQHDAPGTDRETQRPSTADSANSDQSEDFLLHWKKILGHHNVSRRGQFFDLSSDEREALGGTEYRALKILAITVPMYGFLWQFLGAIALGAWIAVNNPTAARDYGANPWWSGIFLSVSAFNNAGMSVIDAGMTVFQGSYFVLFVVGLLVLAGNTAYPLFLRFILWLMLRILKLSPASTYGPWQETVEFILKYPRRVYTTLFPSHATWWLLLILLLINTIDWVAFEVLNIGNPTVEALPMADRIFAGWFQAIAVRAAGFAVVSISALYPAVQLLYMVMMYVSVYPVSITMRHSNVYEERSLGIYDDDPTVAEQPEGEIVTLPSNNNDDPAKRHLRRRATAAVISKTLKKSMTFQGVGVPSAKGDGSPVSFIGQQIRGQLAHDLWWLVVPLLIIMIIETDHFLEQPLAYSIFNVLFEVVSAYGCVGLSVGLPGANYSFSGGMHAGSKVILCIVMLRGRHRGLPVALDKAVRLPRDTLHKEEEEDSRLRRTMTMNRIASRDN